MTIDNDAGEKDFNQDINKNIKDKDLQPNKNNPINPETDDSDITPPKPPAK